MYVFIIIFLFVCNHACFRYRYIYTSIFIDQTDLLFTLHTFAEWWIHTNTSPDLHGRKQQTLSLSLNRLYTDKRNKMAALVREGERVYAFYKKYAWKQLATARDRPAGTEASGRIVRTVYSQFGQWCVDNEYLVGDDNDTKLFWLERILPFLCCEDPCVAVLNGHTSYVMSVALVNATTVVSGSADKTLRVWDLTTNTCTAVLNGHTDYVSSVVVLNETTVVSGSADKTLRVWDLTKVLPEI